MIKELKFISGRSPDSAGEYIAAAPVNIFVGPNNSGKSIALTEIKAFCVNGRIDDAIVIKNIKFETFGEAKAMSAFARLNRMPASGKALPEGHVLLGDTANSFAISDFTNLLNASSDPASIISQWYLRHDTLGINGLDRIKLVDDQIGGDLQQPPKTSFQTLFRNNSKRQEVRRIVFEAFGVHFTLDPTHLGKLRCRLSSRPPADVSEEQGLHAEAISFHNQALHISEFSDGIKAFAGIIAEVIAGDPSVVIIDEPEAFLHPSIANKLGYELCRSASTQEKQIFLSTHSSALVMGCIQSNVPTNIIRLTYNNGVATSRILPSDEILALMRHPLLRSAGMLSALFYEFVIVTESDADRVFYQEINERLLQFAPSKGIRNCLFINAQNKQTIHSLVKPLRQLGIPTAGVVDIDAIKEGGTNWKNLLQSAFMPSLSQDSLALSRAAIKKLMEKTGKDMKMHGGIDILGGEDREAAAALLEQLAQYGMFIVPGGELEAWLKHLGTSGHGPAWVVNMFEKMGEDPNNSDYARPDEGDVWDFIAGIRLWLHNPKRKGIPT
jgi:hypothetical protein